MSTEQATFKDWAIVEIMGHQRYAGYVTTENYGGVSLFRIDVPALPEHEEELKSDRYVDGQFVKAGSRYKVEAIDGFSKLVGAGAIFAITPCTKEAAIADRFRHASRPLIPISIIPADSIRMIALPDSVILAGSEDDKEDYS